MHIHKKGVGVSSSAHPGTTGLRIALPTQDRQRSSAHARTNYIITRYIDTLNADVSVVICLLWDLDEFAKFVVHNDRRSKTSFSMYMTARFTPEG